MLTLMLLAIISAPADDVAKFEGSWSYESMEAAGKPLDIAAFKEIPLVLKGKTFTQGEAKGTFILDDTKTPKTIDLTFTNGPPKGITVKGIYELDDKTYKLCSGKPKGERPKVFDSKAKDGGTISILKRINP